MAPKGKKVVAKKAGAVEKGSTATETKKYKENDFRGNGVLVSSKTSCDLKIAQYSLNAYGGLLIADSSIELNRGNRYGLIGRNGSGKSTLLRSLAARDVEIPNHIDIYLLEHEAPATPLTPLEYVVDEAQKEVEKLEEEIANTIAINPEAEELVHLYNKLDSFDSSKFEEKAGKILHGLGFDEKMLKKGTQDMSGGWRMRVALAKALFVKPTLLILDEPTNHLDLESCVWLEEYLSHWSEILIVNSHSQSFLNKVCTHIMHISHKKEIITYSGNYDQFLITKSENDINQNKQFKKEQDDIQHLKKFINSCGTYSNLVRQAKSKQKIIDKMEEKGLAEQVKDDANFSFAFFPCEKLSPPVVDIQGISFRYNEKDAYLYENVNLAFTADSRVALVGSNGTGKSTLLKLLARQLTPQKGEIKRHTHCRFGFYNQHIMDILSDDITPLQFMVQTFGEGKTDETVWRTALGKYGISGMLQGTLIGKLSDGQKRRLMFSYLAHLKPNMLMLDEPTNHLDMETIDALASAINAFDGGMILVSHDFRLIEQVATEIWICQDRTIKPFNGTISEYKDTLIRHMKSNGIL